MTHNYTRFTLFITLIVGFLVSTKFLIFNVSLTAPDLSGLCVGGNYQNLNSIIIEESNNNDFTATTSGNFLRLQIVGNFEFEPGVGTVSVASGGGEDLSNVSISVSTNQVIIFYDADAPNHNDIMTISGLRVRAITSAGSGVIEMTGGATITSINPNDTDLATLNSVASPSVTLSDSDADNIICAGTTVNFTATGASSYEFFINGISVATNATGLFSTSTLNNGDIVSVEGTNASCTSVSSGTAFTVNPSPFVGLSSSDADNIICQNASITFTAISNGTTFIFRRGATVLQSGASSTYTTNSAISGSYTVEAIIGSCSTTSNAINLTVNPLPDVGYNTTGMTLSYADTETSGKALRGISFGGTLGGVLQGIGVGLYSGPGVVGELFFPNAAGVGDHTISYTYTDANGCSNSASIIIEVFSSIDAIGLLENSYCDGVGIQPSGVPTLTPNTSTVFIPSVTLTRALFNPFTGFQIYTATFTRNGPLTYAITGTGIIGAPGSYKINTNDLVLNLNYSITVEVDYTCISGDCAFFTGGGTGSLYKYRRFKTTRRKSNPNVDFTGIFPGQNICSDVTAIPLNATNTFNSTTVNLPAIDGEYLISRTINPADFSVPSNSVINLTTKVFNPSALQGTTVSGIAIPNPITSTQTLYIKYRYQDADGCTGETPPRLFFLRPIPVPTFSGLLSNYCEGSAILNLTPSFNITDEPFNINKGYFTIKNSLNVSVRTFPYGITSLNLDVPALSPGDNYSVIYNYETSAGCEAVTTPQSFNIKPTPTVDFTGLNAAYCRNEVNSTLSASVNGVPEAGGVFRIRRTTPIANVTTFELLWPDRTFRPQQPLPSVAGVLPGTYEIEYTFAQNYPGPTSCQSVVVKTVTINDLPNLSFDLPTTNGEVCRDVNSVNLTPRVGGNLIFPSPNNGKFRVTRTAPTAGAPFTLADGLNTIDFGSAQFGIPTVGTEAYVYDIEFIYRDGNNCSDTSVIKTLTVNPSPNLDTSNIVITNRCLGETTQFIVNSPFPLDSLVWSGSEIPVTPIKLSGPPPYNFSHTYTSIGSKIIGLTLFNTQGCRQDLSIPFIIRPQPVPNFSFLGQCLGSPTQFTDMTTILTGGEPVSNWSWDFGDGGSSILQNPSHMYTSPGVYNVTLSVQTNLNPNLSCPKQITKSIIIFGQNSPTTTNPYIENFNSSNGGWITGQTTATLSSWQWGNQTTTLNKIRPKDGAFWRTFRGATALDTIQYRSNEQSFLESPCFDLTNLDRPAINFDYWSDTRFGQDGIAVLYSVNDGVSWVTLGNVNQGVEWYNAAGITGLPGSGSPGLPNGSVNGWSGNTQTDWKTARFVLDNVKNLAGVGGRVRFRIVFGSLPLGPGSYDGFAIDNIQISSRNRKILLEHFTNAGAPEVGAEDSFINNIANTQTESIDIRYHASFPNPDDPFNADNTADPSARALFYGISQIPRTIRDGETFTAKYSTIDPLLIEYQKRSLKPSPFEISISFGNNPAELLNVGAMIKAVEDFNKPVIVRIAVIEKQVNGNIVGLTGTTFRNIVKRLLPDAAGTRININWIKNVTQSPVNQSYNPIGFYDKNQMAVVVFVQDETTKEIYQTAYAEPTTIPSGITSIENALNDQIYLYPNPAKDKVYLKTQNLGKFTYQVYDGLGKIITEGEFNGETYELDTQKYAGGLYMIRLMDSNGNMGNKKLIITK
ncbi:MAG: PKD domain-containing protein [Raineya sp.]|jgi:PKD repeat protein|nr:PKD domain-containing protein [Raineya sp.]